MSKHNELNACKSNLVSVFGPGSGPTAEATARWVSEHTRIRAVTSLGRDTTEMSGRKNSVLDSKVAELMTSLYNDARCGRAAAEYNLEKAGMIEMIFGHVAGRMRDCDNFWDDTRWSSPNAAGVLARLSLRASSWGTRPLRSHSGTPRTRPLTSPATVVTAIPTIQSC